MPFTERRSPVIVIDTTAGDDPDLTKISIPGGWTRREGFALPARPWDLHENRWVCTGAVADDAEAEAALAALVRGTGLIIRLGGPGAFRLRVLDDLHHNGQVSMGDEQRSPVADLAADDTALLQALAEGSTVEEAARRVIMSPRTAARRLAAIRTKYGASNTTEAVARWLAGGGGSVSH